MMINHLYYVSILLSMHYFPLICTAINQLQSFSRFSRANPSLNLWPDIALGTRMKLTIRLKNKLPAFVDKF